MNLMSNVSRLQMHRQHRRPGSLTLFDACCYITRSFVLLFFTNRPQEALAIE